MTQQQTKARSKTASRSGIRGKRGKVSWSTVENRLRLNIPACHSPSGRQKQIRLHLDDTPENQKSAQNIVDRINAHIEIFKDYDPRKLDEYIERGSPEAKPIPISSPKKQELTLDKIWAEYAEYQRNFIKETTYKSTYQTAGNHIQRLTTKRLSEADTIAAEIYQLSNATRYSIFCLICACCNWAVITGKIENNPFIHYKKKFKDRRSRKAPDPFTNSAVERIITHYKNHPLYHIYADFIEFMYLTGCRTGEAIALKRKNVNLQKEVIFCASISHGRNGPVYNDSTKTKSSRTFPISSSRLRQLLEKRLATPGTPDDYVFQEPNGSHIKPARFNYSWYGRRSKKEGILAKGIVLKLAELGGEEGIDHYRRAYCLRHTFITLALNRAATQGGINHSDVAQIADYVGNSPEVIYKHYLGRSGKENLVNIGNDPLSTESETPFNQSSTGLPLTDPVNIVPLVADLMQQVNELKQQNQILQQQLNQSILNQTSIQTEPRSSLTPSDEDLKDLLRFATLSKSVEISQH